MKHSLLSILKSSGPIKLDDLTGLLEAEIAKSLHELEADGLLVKDGANIKLTDEAIESFDENEHNARTQFLEYLKHHVAK